MLSSGCFMQGCTNQPRGKCDCNNSTTLFCVFHAFDHIKTPSNTRHIGLDLCFKPLEATKSVVKQKVISLISDIHNFRTDILRKGNEIIDFIYQSIQNTLIQLDKAEKNCKNIIKLSSNPEIVDIPSENNISQILKLNEKDAKIHLKSWKVPELLIDIEKIKSLIKRDIGLEFVIFKGNETQAKTKDISYLNEKFIINSPNFEGNIIQMKTSSNQQKHISQSTFRDDFKNEIEVNQKENPKKNEPKIDLDKLEEQKQQEVQPEIVKIQWACDCGFKNEMEWDVCGWCHTIKPGESGWICKRCTFKNDNKNDTCEICSKNNENESKYWRCLKCKHLNKLSDGFCGTCLISKTRSRETVSETQEILKTKWKCDKCYHMNAMSVGKCDKCCTPKSLLETQEIEEPKWKCAKCYHMNAMSVGKCDKCCTPKSLLETQEIEKLKWKCAKCNHMNAMSVGICYKCFASKSLFETKEIEKLKWKCPSCNSMNLKDSAICYKCNTLKSVLEAKEIEKPKWKCSKCSHMNAVERSFCFKCNAVKSVLENAEPKKNSSEETKMSSGWICKCGYSNELRTNFCYNCYLSAPKVKY